MSYTLTLKKIENKDKITWCLYNQHFIGYNPIEKKFYIKLHKDNYFYFLDDCFDTFDPNNRYLPIKKDIDYLKKLNQNLIEFSDSDKLKKFFKRIKTIDNICC